MKLFKKVLAGVAVAAALATSAHASVINVQGILWDPDSVAPDDFQATTNLFQWYQSSAAYDPTGTVTSFTGATSLVNKFVTGAGLFSQVNGVDTADSNPGDTTPADFAAGQLTYIFGGIEITGVTVSGTSAVYSYDLTNSYFNVYSNANANNYGTSGTLAGQVAASVGSYATPFLTGHFDAFSVDALLLNLTTGSPNLFGSANGLISVTGGAAYSNFDTNTKINPNDQSLSDISFGGSSQINFASSISTVGTANMLGNTIPEPASIALIGLAMLGAGVASRRKAAKK